MEFVVSSVQTYGSYDEYCKEVLIPVSGTECRGQILNQLRSKESGLQNVAKKCKQVDLLKDIKKCPLSNMNGFISTKVGRFKHIMMFDCDSVDASEFVSDDLRRDGRTAYDVWESSPGSGKTWIFCDSIGTPKRLTNIWESLIINSGADERHAILAVARGRLLIRAFPKHGTIPQCIESKREYGRSKYYKKWIKEFAEYWSSPAMQKLNEQIFVQAL